MVKKFAVIAFLKKAVFHGEIDRRNNSILDDLTEWLTIRWILIELIAYAEFGLSFGHIGLQCMHIHFIPIEIGVVAFTIGVIHAKSGFFRQNFHAMSHQSCFMQSGLTVE